MILDSKQCMELMILTVIILVRPWVYQLCFNCTQDCECKIHHTNSKASPFTRFIHGTFEISNEKGGEISENYFRKFYFSLKKQTTNNLKTSLFYESYEILETLPTPREST